MKLLLSFTLLLFIYHIRTEITPVPNQDTPLDEEIIQEILDGFVRELNLEAPTTVLTCLNETVSENITQFYYTILHKLATSDFVTINKTVKQFKEAFPSSVGDCIANNPQIQNILEELGLKNISLAHFYSKFTLYILQGKFRDLIDGSYEIQKEFDLGNFEEVGAKSCKLLKKILKNDSDLQDLVKAFSSKFKFLTFLAETPLENKIEAKQDPEEEYKKVVLQKALKNVRDMFAGIFLRSKVPSNTGKDVVERCFDGNNAKITMDALTQIIYQFITKDFFSIPETIENYKQKLSPEVLICLENDSDVREMLMEYQIYGKSLNDLYVKTAEYVYNEGLDTLIGAISKIGHQLKYRNMQNAGSEIGKLLNAIIKEED